MRLPFTSDQFFEVFRRYNEAVWPAQFLLLALACVAILLAVRGKSGDGRLVSAILAGLWLWMAIAYHLTFFASINRAASLFATLFGVQALLFVRIGVWKGRLDFRSPWNVSRVTGALLMVYALVAYPLLGAALGHRYPASPTFGLPCPTTIFTFALLLWAGPTVPRPLLVVPLLWAAIGTSAAVALGVREDFGLGVAGVIVATMLLGKREGSRARMPASDAPKHAARVRP